jgi:hypothetical protein
MILMRKNNVPVETSKQMIHYTNEKYGSDIRHRSSSYHSKD